MKWSQNWKKNQRYNSREQPSGNQNNSKLNKLLPNHYRIDKRSMKMIWTSWAKIWKRTCWGKLTLACKNWLIYSFLHPTSWDMIPNPNTKNSKYNLSHLNKLYFDYRDNFDACIQEINDLSFLFVTTHGGLLDLPLLLQKTYLILKRDQNQKIV